MTPTVYISDPDVKWNGTEYSDRLINTGLSRRGERYHALPFVVRHGYYSEGLKTVKSLAAYVLKWIKEKHNGYEKQFIQNWRRVILTVKRLVSSHIQWVKAKKKLDPQIQSQLEGVVPFVLQKAIDIFAPKNKLRATSVKKLEAIVRNVLQYVYKCGTTGVVALPKKAFIVAGAYDGGRDGLCHYLNIKRALEELGILTSHELDTYAGGPCQMYDVDWGEYMKLAPEDEFVDRKTKGKNTVRECDKFSANILSVDVHVTGVEVQAFAKAFENKLRSYLNNPFLNILPIKRVGNNWAYYVRGAAICKNYSFDVKRFIEAQFYWFHQWQDEAPNIKYVVSTESEWSSVGRYQAYCDKFKREIGSLRGADNIEAVTRAKRTAPVPKSSKRVANTRGARIFERVKENYGLSEVEILLHWGHPLKPLLPLDYLVEQAKWLELLLEGAWGKNVNKSFFDTDIGRGILD